jgi:hypothetical protein
VFGFGHIDKLQRRGVKDMDPLGWRIDIDRDEGSQQLACVASVRGR